MAESVATEDPFVLDAAERECVSLDVSTIKPKTIKPKTMERSESTGIITIEGNKSLHYNIEYRIRHMLCIG